MTTVQALLLFGATTLVVGLVTPALVKPALLSFKLVDVPNHRSSHETPTLRGAGIAVATTVLIGGVVAILADPQSVPLIVPVVTVSILFSAVGFVEDFRGLRVSARISLQMLLSLAVSVWLLAVTHVSLFWVLLLVPIGIFYINAANFMDGVNGISSLEGIAVGATALAVGLIANSQALAILGLISSLAFLGFLPWNFPKAKMFLGDSGSYLLGGLALGLGLLTFLQTSSVLAAVAPMLVYSSDVIFTLIQRLLRGEDLTQSHDEHLYQVVKRRYQSHIVSSIYAFSFTATICVVAVLQIAGAMSHLVAWALVAVLLGVYLVIGDQLKRTELQAKVAAK